MLVKVDAAFILSEYLVLCSKAPSTRAAPGLCSVAALFAVVCWDRNCCNTAKTAIAAYAELQHL